MNTRAILIPVLALLVGGAAGWLLRGNGGRGESGTGDSVGERQPAARSHPDRGQGGERHRGPGRGGGTRPADDEDAEDAEKIHVDPAAAAAMIGAKVSDLERRTQLVSQDEPLARFLSINAEETTALNGLWEDLLPKLRVLRSEHVGHQELDDGRMWIGVSPFPEQGDALRKDLLLTTISLLGEARAKVFLDSIDAHDAFGQWGKTTGSGFAIRVRVQDDGSYLYEITEQARADGRPGRTWQTSQVPAHLQDLAEAAGIALQP